MANVSLEPTGPPKAAEGPSGEGWDKCPNDGTEVEASFTFGGDGPKGDGHYNSWMYSCPGCRECWMRHTRQGRDRAQDRGINPKWVTKSAARGQTISVPSPQYSANWSRAFGKTTDE